MAPEASSFSLRIEAIPTLISASPVGAIRIAVPPVVESGVSWFHLVGIRVMRCRHRQNLEMILCLLPDLAVLNSLRRVLRRVFCSVSRREGMDVIVVLTFIGGPRGDLVRRYMMPLLRFTGCPGAGTWQCFGQFESGPGEESDKS